MASIFGSDELFQNNLLSGASSVTEAINVIAQEITILNTSNLPNSETQPLTNVINNLNTEILQLSNIDPTINIRINNLESTMITKVNITDQNIIDNNQNDAILDLQLNKVDASVLNAYRTTFEQDAIDVILDSRIANIENDYVVNSQLNSESILLPTSAPTVSGYKIFNTTQNIDYSITNNSINIPTNNFGTPPTIYDYRINTFNNTVEIFYADGLVLNTTSSYFSSSGVITVPNPDSENIAFISMDRTENKLFVAYSTRVYSTTDFINFTLEITTTNNIRYMDMNRDNPNKLKYFIYLDNYNFHHRDYNNPAWTLRDNPQYAISMPWNILYVNNTYLYVGNTFAGANIASYRSNTGDFSDEIVEGFNVSTFLKYTTNTNNTKLWFWNNLADNSDQDFNNSVSYSNITDIRFLPDDNILVTTNTNIYKSVDTNYLTFTDIGLFSSPISVFPLIEVGGLVINTDIGANSVLTVDKALNFLNLSNDEVRSNKLDITTASSTYYPLTNPLKFIKYETKVVAFLQGSPPGNTLSYPWMGQSTTTIRNQIFAYPCIIKAMVLSCRVNTMSTNGATFTLRRSQGSINTALSFNLAIGSTNLNAGSYNDVAFNAFENYYILCDRTGSSGNLTDLLIELIVQYI